eukprot:15480735-Alexandrium_andersonii.AAC.1
MLVGQLLRAGSCSLLSLEVVFSLLLRCFPGVGGSRFPKDGASSPAPTQMLPPSTVAPSSSVGGPADTSVPPIVSFRYLHAYNGRVVRLGSDGSVVHGHKINGQFRLGPHPDW